MKIFDCFMYFDEDVVLDVRLNTLNQYVDYFVIVESLFTHKGEQRNLNFDIKNFSKFKNKIIYLVYENESSLMKKLMKMIQSMKNHQSISLMQFTEKMDKETLSQRDLKQPMKMISY